MKAHYYTAAVILLAGSVAAFADTKTPCSQTLNVPLQSRADLIIDSRPAGLQIVATDGNELHVSCSADNSENAGEVSLQFSPTSNGGKLSIKGHEHPGNNGVQIKIEVPRRTNLAVHMFAGQVTVDGVKGDKDIDIGAGQITISSIRDGDYRSVDASVGIGQVQAQAYGVDKGGFFRSFKKQSPTGDYRLQAHVTTGQVSLLGNAEHEGSAPKPD
ncbi:hypothetical protein [Occallatibacter riparius]|uniref:Adhesin domain-containing protein n=1 Tax=Occallatibacter riparius TaxID=1002689 RepID=A0A9J7BY03_9BACT|nr:hypothetical protein [Occallatibacter riparius]UWZ86014.1 hypothetical protein MOP44_08725 [Occallatibacter riparius]